MKKAWLYGAFWSGTWSPEKAAGTEKVMKFIAEEISRDTYVNIMDQYNMLVLQPLLPSGFGKKSYIQRIPCRLKNRRQSGIDESSGVIGGLRKHVAECTEVLHLVSVNSVLFIRSSFLTLDLT